MIIKTAFLTLTALIGCQTLSAQQRPVIPLEYVSEYSLGTNTQTGDFATSHRNDACGWYTPESAERLCPSGYHIPSEYELYSIVPKRDNSYPPKVENFGFGNGIHTNHPEDVEFGGKRYHFTADYNCPRDNNNVIYSIRFIGQGNTYRCAYRYVKRGHFGTEAGWGDFKSYLMIQAKYIGPSGSVTLDDVSKESYWQTGGIVTRILPANGKYSVNNEAHRKLGGGWYGTKVGGMISILAKSGTPITGNLFEQDLGLCFQRFQGAVHENYVYGGTAVARPFLNELPAEPQYDKEPIMVHSIYTANVENRPALPIDYIADFNVGTPQATFNITDPSKDGSQFQPGKYMDKMPPGYHIPTLREWCGIFPDYINLQNDDRNTEDEETITVNGKTANYKACYLAFWLNRKYFITYALKFINETNELLSAYKYEFDRKTYNMKVSCRYLGPAFKGNVHELAYPEFWMTDDVITIQLPMTNNSGGNEFRDVFGNYQVTDDNVTKNFTVGSGLLGVQSVTKYRYYEGVPSVIRPFKNSLKPKSPAKSATAAKSNPVKRNTGARPAQRKK